MTANVVAAAVVLAIAFMIFWAFRSSGGAGRGETLRAERLHAWEKGLTLEQEEALLRGVQAWRDAGHDLLVQHEGGKLDVFEPPCIVSLFALAERFVATSAKGRDATAIVAELLDELSVGVPGASLRLRAEWYAKPVAGDAGNFTRLASDLLSNARETVAGIEGSFADERRGVIDLTVRGEKGLNTVVIDLARIVNAFHEKREEDDKTPVIDLVRSLLRDAIQRERDGVLWVRAPSAEERGTALRSLEASTVG